MTESMSSHMQKKTAMSSHMQKKNSIITQFCLDIMETPYWEILLACPGVTDNTNKDGQNQIGSIYVCLTIYKKSTSYLRSLK